MMRLYLGCDHRGVQFKEELISYFKAKGIEALDIGLPNSSKDDYPEFAFKLGELVRDNKDSLGVLICGTGIGMSIAANKVKGVRAVRAVSVEDAYTGRLHNGANVITLGYDTTPDLEEVKEIVMTFVTTDMPREERHIKRINDIEKYEDR